MSRDIYTSNPIKIVHTFPSYLASLYSEVNTSNITEADSFFSRIKLPELTLAQRNLLDKPILVDDVTNAIKELKRNKRPGPDRYSALYYQTFKETLSPILTDAFNVLLDGHSFKQKSLTASICMIPKPHSDDTSCTNYRPISLLNLDIKILAKKC